MIVGLIYERRTTHHDQKKTTVYICISLFSFYFLGTFHDFVVIRVVLCVNDVSSYTFAMALPLCSGKGERIFTAIYWLLLQDEQFNGKKLFPNIEGRIKSYRVVLKFEKCLAGVIYISSSSTSDWIFFLFFSLFPSLVFFFASFYYFFFFYLFVLHSDWCTLYVLYVYVISWAKRYFSVRSER